MKRRSPLKSSSKKNSPKSSVRKNFTPTDKSAIENQENCINGIANKDDDSRKPNTKSSASTVPISEQTGIFSFIINLKKTIPIKIITIFNIFFIIDDVQVTSAPYSGIFYDKENNFHTIFKSH